MIVTLVLSIFTLRFLVSTRFFRSLSSESNSCMVSASSTRSSDTIRNSWDNASRAMMNNKGLSTEPWWATTCTLKTSLNLLFAFTWLLAFRYITCITRTIHSGIRTFCKAHHRTFLGNLSNAFSRSIKTKSIFRFFLMYTSWTCLTIKTVSVVPRPGISPINNEQYCGWNPPWFALCLF